jgi:Protein of unknown function (DUF1579)
MRIKALFCVVTIMACSVAAVVQHDQPADKLGAFLGKWQTEGQFAGSESKVQTTLECRWSPQGSYLICEQTIRMGGSEHRQLTVYSYNATENNYAYTTLADPGAKPTSGRMEIKGNVWTYASSFESNGRVTHLRTTNEFTDPKTEIFKVESSNDGGATWKTMLQGSAHKTGD